MTANGAGSFRCTACHATLADVRKRLDGKRYLSIRQTVKVTYLGDGELRLRCPKCNTVRPVHWRVLPDGDT